MLETYFGLIEATFVFGLAVAFYIWQRNDLKKEKAKDLAKAEAAARHRAAEAAAAGSAGPDPAAGAPSSAGPDPTGSRHDQPGRNQDTPDRQG
ncbi:hypothetical protein [Pannonibacter tanglangensis]|uniref:Uncharacterized protein n=1 Tax=Pannonibacter tanglangensis TaxID=2750084 RepID=A0ABW9ZKA1_9HYPH|nr:hypothetical protein [Pannonibacter sp. XCT-34]NBN63135.1 hypothetical protein [Pannonibacter sp. XCT-34]